MSIEYELPADAVVIDNGSDEIRIRKGVWNYEEAVIDFHSSSADVCECIREMIHVLRNGGSYSPEDRLKKSRMNADSLAEVKDLIDGLVQQNFLVDAESSLSEMVMNEIMPGMIPAGRHLTAGPVLFFSDERYLREEAERAFAELDVPVHIMTSEEYMEIINCNAAGETDGYIKMLAVNRLKRFLEPYSCVAGGLSSLNLTFMRNLNRGLTECSKPLAMAFTDGPFVSMFVIKPPETGCFECMEQRILARIEEHDLYHRYMRERDAGSGNCTGDIKKSGLPFLVSAVHTVIAEALSIASAGKARMAGRALNTYVPVMEMQMQDILRIPYCPACGSMAAAQVREMYTSSRKIVDRVVEKINLT